MDFVESSQLKRKLERMGETVGEESTPSNSNTTLVSVTNATFNVPLIFPMINVKRLSNLDSMELSQPLRIHDLETKIKTARNYSKKRCKPTVLESIPEDELWVFRTLSESNSNEELAVKITHRNRSRLLCEAVSRNDKFFLENLIRAGISPNCFDNHKRTPLHIGVSKGYCEIVQYLLDKGADPNVKDGLGNSCLHLAACTNNVEMTLILIKGGASVHAVDIRGRSPIQLAQSRLKILQRCPDGFIKGKIKEVIDMLLMYLQMGSESRNNNEEATLLSSFQNRLQITDSPDQVCSEIDNLSKILDQMSTLKL